MCVCVHACVYDLFVSEYVCVQVCMSLVCLCICFVDVCVCMQLVIYLL